MDSKSKKKLEPMGSENVRKRLTVTGVVQGVGFRPFVYGLALKYGIVGFVGNDSRGVFIEIEGDGSLTDAFLEDLVNSPPPLAHIESVVEEMLTPLGEDSFTIVHSQAQSTENTLISPDICICNDCYEELLDPGNRRYRYPFINCTNCGPRFSIIKDIPYDRPLTTMAPFPMCAECQGEYEDPLDRRFHAQPNACAVCGPHIWLELSGVKQVGTESISSDSQSVITEARRLLKDGNILAVKGLGGFHLACNAHDDEALRKLRERKGRVDKPFAVMALDMNVVREFAEVSTEEEEILISKERPIVLVREKQDSPLSTLVAPDNQYVGVMLPYTPVHYLLLHGDEKDQTPKKGETYNWELGTGNGRKQSTDSSPQLTDDRKHEDDDSKVGFGNVLVMTSGNFSDEPIVMNNAEARERLGNLADAFIMHNRDIYARCDDSVIRVVEGIREDGEPESEGVAKAVEGGVVLPVRRSRGYAPFPVKLSKEVDPVLAVGGELKATFCLAKGQYAYMSQHIGDMENMETLLAFEAAVDHFKHIFRSEPEKIACDLHPGYLSSRWAQEKSNELPVIQVQHHHAHIASVMAEHQLDGTSPVIGFSFDGTGYGTDGAIWGGEVLIADYSKFERYSHLKYVPLVGGDTAVKRPYRLALAHLHSAGVSWNEHIPSVQICSDVELGIIEKQLISKLNSVPTSSMGRLFDAVASIAGVRQRITYEAQAAIEFEAMKSPGDHSCYKFAIKDGVFDAAPVVVAAVYDVLEGVNPGIISARFHGAVAQLILDLCIQIRAERGLSIAALSGGVFQNVTLLSQTVILLQNAGFEVLFHRLVPPNDGGIALGQAIIASH